MGSAHHLNSASGLSGLGTSRHGTAFSDTKGAQVPVFVQRSAFT